MISASRFAVNYQRLPEKKIAKTLSVVLSTGEGRGPWIFKDVQSCIDEQPAFGLYLHATEGFDLGFGLIDAKGPLFGTQT